MSLKTQCSSLSGGPAATLLASPTKNEPSENNQVSCSSIYMFWGPGFSLQSPFVMWLQNFESSAQWEDRTPAVLTWCNFAEREQIDSGHSLESEELVPPHLHWLDTRLAAALGTTVWCFPSSCRVDAALVKNAWKLYSGNVSNSKH